MLKIGSSLIDPPLMLAPMVDLTGNAFRELVRSYGGCGLYYSEMLNARRVAGEGINHPLYKGFGEENNLMLQLLGNDPRDFATAMSRLQDLAPIGFDLNLGCSRGSIVNRGWGSALCQSVEQTKAILQEMRRRTTGLLTVKLRRAWTDDQQAKNFISMLENEGVDALIIHPRGTDKIFARPADWPWIEKVKHWVTIPVIGNGDIHSPQQALALMSQTGCDGVMIGRGAVARPTLFREIQALLQQKTPSPTPSPSQIFKTFIAMGQNEWQQPKRLRELRLFCRYFSEGLPVPHWFWGPMQSDRDPEKIIEKALAFFERHHL